MDDFADFSHIDDTQQPQTPFDMNQYLSNPPMHNPQMSGQMQSPPQFQSPMQFPNPKAQMRYFTRVQSPPLNPTINKKSKWTPDEDTLLRNLVKKEGTNNWSLIAESIPGRTGKQCRERWLNQLRPDLTKNNWTPHEDSILIHQQRIYGNMWTKIAQFLPGRSPNNVKNRWSYISRHQTSSTLFAQMIPFAQQNQMMPNTQIQDQQPLSPQISYNGLPMTMNLALKQETSQPIPSYIEMPNTMFLQTAPPEMQWNRTTDLPNFGNSNHRQFAFSDPTDPINITPFDEPFGSEQYDSNQDPNEIHFYEPHNDDDFGFDF